MGDDGAVSVGGSRRIIRGSIVGIGVVCCGCVLKGCAEKGAFALFGGLGGTFGGELGVAEESSCAFSRLK